ncbi:23560_t:CDS:2 [Dentiscutata erythropus]|uniref:23560_t:CDS:1 n=1 Tax=Dentiscutata erythropus TaxID=1348616 RepID=A0A9N9AIP6_9GLOM|nr:23560_t:CDS:2 [Dentiscutata erythropus]
MNSHTFFARKFKMSQSRPLLPNVHSNQMNNNSEYLNSRREKDKQRKREKRALESDEQKDKRNQQNAPQKLQKNTLVDAKKVPLKKNRKG